MKYTICLFFDSSEAEAEGFTLAREDVERIAAELNDEASHWVGYQGWRVDTEAD